MARNQKKNTVDKKLLWITGLLLALGLLTLTSASIALSLRQFGHPYYYILRQLLLGVGAGSLLFLAGFRVPLARLRTYAPHILIASIILMLLVFMPYIGTTVKGAARWIRVGPFSLQPAEVLKFTFVMYLSSWLSSRKKEIGSFSLGFVPFFFITAFVSVFLILQKDLGTLGIIVFTSLGLFFLGGGKRGQIALAVFIAFFAFLLLVASGYRKDRILVFLNPERDPQHTGYQINQSLIAIGSGGFLGRGLGLSRQKFSYLPEPAGDAIFAIFAEEFGFFGVSVLLGVFMALFLRGMMIAAKTKDYFAALCAGGISLLVIIQVIINVGALSGVLPLTGIPLPFVSYGGTALAFLLFEMGLLLQISKQKT